MLRGMLEFAVTNIKDSVKVVSLHVHVTMQLSKHTLYQYASSWTKLY